MVALCDCDYDYADNVFREYPKAKKYQDFRVMLEKQKDIDAVVIATPDHTHAITAAIAHAAWKTCHLQKPLTHSVWESRYLTQLAKSTGVVTQMEEENLIPNDTVYEVAEVVQSGCLGTIKEAHVWTHMLAYLAPRHAHAVDQSGSPKNFGLGHVYRPAKKRGYHPQSHPWIWRGWWDFGTGALGATWVAICSTCLIMPCNLAHPVAFQASSSLVNTESARFQPK